MTETKTRRQYTDEEKKCAVALSLEKGVPAVSAELSVDSSLLWRWRQKFNGPGKAPPQAIPALSGYRSPGTWPEATRSRPRG